MTKNELREIKHQIRINMPSLRYQDFKIWQDNKKIKLQCYNLLTNTELEFYGNIYEVLDINKSILKVIN